MIYGMIDLHVIIPCRKTVALWNNRGTRDGIEWNRKRLEARFDYA